MANYYLKTNDEASLWEALEAANLAVKDYDPEDALNVRPEDAMEDESWVPTGAFDWRFTGTALDIIGAIWKETGNMLTDDEGLEYPEMAAVDGFHANLIADNADGLPTVDAPATPYRKWAGN